MTFCCSDKDTKNGIYHYTLEEYTSDTVHPSSSKCETAPRTEEMTSESTPLSRVSRITPTFSPFKGLDSM